MGHQLCLTYYRKQQGLLDTIACALLQSDLCNNPRYITEIENNQVLYQHIQSGISTV